MPQFRDTLIRWKYMFYLNPIYILLLSFTWFHPFICIIYSFPLCELSRLVYSLRTWVITQFVRSIREANFSLYHDSLEQIAPWIFLLDHTHYGRWLSVYLQLLREMPVRHPDVYIQFQRGEFVIQKGNRKFSCMGIDHAHEQNNKVVEGAGGVKGILDYLMRY